MRQTSFSWLCLSWAVVVGWILGVVEGSHSASSLRRRAQRRDLSDMAVPLRKFVWLSDLQLDPWYGTNAAWLDDGSGGGDAAPCHEGSSTDMGQYGCESSLELVKNAIFEAASVELLDHPDFVVVTGNMLRSDFSKGVTAADTQKDYESPLSALEAVLTEDIGPLLVKAFQPEEDEEKHELRTGESLFLPVLGPTDVVPAYFLPLENLGSNNDDDIPKSALDFIAAAYLQLKIFTKEEAALFARGGFYSRVVIAPENDAVEQETGVSTVRAICLNTVIYSPRHQPPVSHEETDPVGQLAWLQQQLQDAADQGHLVYIFGSIPPTIAVKDTRVDAPMPEMMDLWRPRFVESYVTLLQRFSETVQGQFFGSTHADEFRVAAASSSSDSPLPPLLLGPSVTPVDHTNPAFRVVYVDPSTAQVLDMDTYYHDLSEPTATEEKKWSLLYNFQNTYGVSDLSTSTLQGLVQQLQQGGADSLRSFLQRRRVGTSPPSTATDCAIDDNCRAVWICVLQSAAGPSVTSPDFQSCLPEAITSTLPQPVTNVSRQEEQDADATTTTTKFEAYDSNLLENPKEEAAIEEEDSEHSGDAGLGRLGDDVSNKEQVDEILEEDLETAEEEEDQQGNGDGNDDDADETSEGDQDLDGDDADDGDDFDSDTYDGPVYERGNFTTDAAGAHLRRFVWLTDIHYDPWYGLVGAAVDPTFPEEDITPICQNDTERLPNFANPNCDSSWALVESVLQAAGDLEILDRPDFVVITGDFVRYSLSHVVELLKEEQDISEVVEAVAQALVEAFEWEEEDEALENKASIFFPVLGHTDVVPEYFVPRTPQETSETQPTSMEALGGVFQELNILSADEADTFRTGGYYARQIANESEDDDDDDSVSISLTAICLNTVVYSPVPERTDEDRNVEDPLGQFAWLEGLLSKAVEGQQAFFLFGHIPPALDSYDEDEDGVDLWEEQYLKRYRSIVQTYSSLIQGQFYGHLHTDEFRLFYHDEQFETTNSGGLSKSSAAIPPILIGPAVTPVLGNNPAFRLVHYAADSGIIQNMDTYFTNLESDRAGDEWKKLYSFAENYNVPDLSAASLHNLVQRMEGKQDDTNLEEEKSSQLVSDFLTKRLVNANTVTLCEGICRERWICTLKSGGLTSNHDFYTTCMDMEEQVIGDEDTGDDGEKDSDFFDDEDEGLDDNDEGLDDEDDQDDEDNDLGDDDYTGEVVTRANFTTDHDPNLRRFVWLSDIHYDPWYGKKGAASDPTYTEGTKPACINQTSSFSPFATYDCDSSWKLVQSALEGAGDLEILDRPDFVVLTGDFVRYELERVTDDVTAPSEVSNIVRTVAETLIEAFSWEEADEDLVNKASILLPVLGHTDVVPEYYVPRTADNLSGSLMETIGDIFQELGILSDDEALTFQKGGYYSRQVVHKMEGDTTPTIPVTAICLNTVLYSPVPERQNEEADVEDPLGQFAWMEGLLEEAAGQMDSHPHSFFIFGHIPPALDSYNEDGDGVDLWEEAYLQRYRSIVQKYSKLINGQFYGHLHTDEFRLFYHDDQLDGQDLAVGSNGELSASSSEIPPVLIGPAVTPVLGNNPSFRLVHYEGNSGTIHDVDTYYTNLMALEQGEWSKLYSFRQAYGIPDLSSTSLHWLVKRMEGTVQDGGEDAPSSDLLVRDFLTNRRVHSSYVSACAGICRLRWICTLKSGGLASSHGFYQQCMGDEAALGGDDESPGPDQNKDQTPLDNGDGGSSSSSNDNSGTDSGTSTSTSSTTGSTKDTDTTQSKYNWSAHHRKFAWLSDLHLDTWYGKLGAAENPRKEENSPDVCQHRTTAPADGRYGCDSPLSLIRSAVRQAADVSSDGGLRPDFVAITGDFARYSMETKFFEDFDEPLLALGDIVLEVSREIVEAFLTPEEQDELQAEFMAKNADKDAAAGDAVAVPNEALSQRARRMILPVIGHTDLLMNGYFDTPTEPVIDSSEGDPSKMTQADVSLKAMEQMTKKFVTMGVLSDDEASTFGRGGFYVRDVLPADQGDSGDAAIVTAICLNTVIYSPYIDWTTASDQEVDPEDPFEQFSWLEMWLDQLTTSVPRGKSRVVYLFGHVPPTVSSYDDHRNLWEPKHLERYRAIVQKYSFMIKGQFFGQLHTDEFRLFDEYQPHDNDNNDDDDDKKKKSGNDDKSLSLPPIFIGPAITPIMGNDPAFRVVHYDSSNGIVEDIDTYHTDMSPFQQTLDWKMLYSFRQAYAVDDLSHASLRTLVERLKFKHDSQEQSTLDAFLKPKGPPMEDLQEAYDQDPDDEAHTLLLEFLSRYRGGAHWNDTAGCHLKCRHEWVCTLEAGGWSQETFQRCAADEGALQPWYYGGGTKSGTRVVNIVMISLGVVALVVSVYQCYLKREQRRLKYRYKAALTAASGVVGKVGRKVGRRGRGRNRKPDDFYDDEVVDFDEDQKQGEEDHCDEMQQITAEIL